MSSSQIYRASTFQDLWEGYLRDWFSKSVQHSWKSNLPTVILVPHRTYGNYLKSCLLEAGFNYAGIFFWTPFQCREYLFSQQKNIPGVLKRENLSLLIASLADFSEDRDYAKSIGTDADHLRQCLDLIDSAGWNPEKIFPEPVQKIIRQLDEDLSSKSLSRQYILERRLIEKFYSLQPSLENQSPDFPPLIESLLVIGFDGSKWPVRPLIHATRLASHQSTFAFILSPTDMTEMDRAWVRYWEQCFSPAIPVSIKRTSQNPYSRLFEGDKEGKIQVRIGKDIEEQVSAIVLQTIAYLSDPSCTRLGILFPGPGALPRETSIRLSELKIPHQDAIRHWRMNQTQIKPWTAWLKLQKHWSMTQLLKFVQASSTIANDFEAEIQKIHRLLEKSFGEVLVEDLDVLIAYLSRSENPEHQSLIEKLQGWPRLTERGCLKDYLAETRQALHRMKLDSLYSSLLREADSLLESWDSQISRDHYLKWLGKILDLGKKDCIDTGNHPFSKVHLLSYSEAYCQNWSHLILTGLNADSWPPRFEGFGWLSEHQIEKLNLEAKNINFGIQIPLKITDLRGMIPGPEENRLSAECRFRELIRSVSGSICVTASLTDETQPGVSLSPSEYLIHLYYADRGEILTDNQMKKLCRETSAWLKDSLSTQSQKSISQPVQQTVIAYQKRRLEGEPFGEYEFVLTRPPLQPVVLSCKAWEEALQYPAHVWMREILGVEPSRSEAKEDRWNLTTGTWVHRWMNHALRPPDKKGFVPFPAHQDFLNKLNQSAKNTRSVVEWAFQQAGRNIPLWWQSGWNRACTLAIQLANHLSAVRDWPYLSSEHNLPDDFRYSIPESGDLYLKGRLDLLLLKDRLTHWRSDGTVFGSTPVDSLLANQIVWIIDFKTGQSKKINPKKFSSENLQLSLYALALSSMSAKEVMLSIASPESPLDPVAVSEPLKNHEDLWKALIHIQNTGVFGMPGVELRPEFGMYPDYPLATLEIDPDILKEKWELTHPLLGKEDS